MKARREKEGLSQDALATRARDFGLNWSRSTVTKLEAGDRDLSAEEFLLLPLLLNAPLTDLVSGPELEWVSVASEVKVRRRALRQLLTGSDPRDVNPKDYPESRPWRRSIAKFAGLDPTDHDAIDRLAGQLHGYGRVAYGEAEQKAAGKLGIEPLELLALSYRRWKRSLTAERERVLDKRLDEPGEVKPRSRQAMRGRVTRKLIDELRQELDRKGREGQ